MHIAYTASKNDRAAMRFSKPSFSKVQRDFLEKFNECLKKEFDGGQVALAARIGCDQSSISRWINRDSAPPDYVCRLLLKELGIGSFKQSLGQRIQVLREEVFGVSLRELTWALQLESVSQLEEIEQGEVELPRPCIERLMRDYQVSAAYLDHGGEVFAAITHSAENVRDHLKEGFQLCLVTPPAGHEDRSWLRCRFILHRERQSLPQCFATSATGSFRSTGGGLLAIEDALRGVKEAAGDSVLRPPAVLMADKKSWKALHEARFYMKKLFFGAGSSDVRCGEKLHEILASLPKRSVSQ